MKKYFVSYKIAVLAKNNEFDKECLACWTPVLRSNKFRLRGCGAIWFDVDGLYKNDDPLIVAAPLYHQLLDWFKKQHKIYINQIDSEDDDSYFIKSGGWTSSIGNIDETLILAFDFIKNIKNDKGTKRCTKKP